VHLQPAPIPRVSLIPRVSKPQRLVELHPIVPVVSPQSISAPRVRKSSGTSVKDLVRGFEELGEQVTEREAPREIGLKRVRSNRSGVNVVQQQPKLWEP
jgi:hypothetical protein